MNLYINILKINNLKNNIINHLDEYKYKVNNLSLIFTEKYILQNIHNSIYKISIIDEPIKTLNYNDYNIICDNSKIIKQEQWYQIPYNYITVNTTKYYYQLRDKALVNLVIEKNDNNNIVSCYFYTKETLITDSIIEDINSFLSLLNIKQ